MSRLTNRGTLATVARDIGLPDDVLRRIHSHLEFFPGLPASKSVCLAIRRAIKANGGAGEPLAYLHHGQCACSLYITPGSLQVYAGPPHAPKRSIDEFALLVNKSDPSDLLNISKWSNALLQFVLPGERWQFSLDDQCVDCEGRPLACSGLCACCTIKSIVLATDQA